MLCSFSSLRLNTYIDMSNTIYIYNIFSFNVLQVAQVLLTLPYSFSQLGLLSGILFQLFYGLMGSWTAYLISVLYMEYRTRKEREKVDFRNHVIQVIYFIHLHIINYRLVS